uniref:Uncharacterized protein n=1 Tax=Burkholderia phage vB_BgluM-SURPRISE13 TaxID=3159457 RepID=A0AAU7PHA9_9VIRU
MFFNDFDNEDQYPANGTLEEKAVFSLEQLRTRFWWEKKNYLQNRAGGPRHTATLLAFGERSAGGMAQHAESAFQNYLKQAYLTEDGETTDPKYPTDKMINSELRRIRSLIILNCSQYMEKFETMMPESLDLWTRDMIYFNLFPYVERYTSEAYDQIAFVIPGKKLQARSPADLEKFIAEQASGFADEITRRNFTHSVLVHRIRDNLIEFLLQDLPFNNDRLQKKNDLIPKPAEEGEPTKVLH